MDRTQLAAQLAAIAGSLATMNETVTKIGTETQGLLDRVGELTTAVENAGNTTPEIDAALEAVETQRAALAAALSAVDAKVPDAPGPDPEPAPEPAP